MVSFTIFEEFPFCFPIHDDFNVYVLLSALEVNRNVDKKEQYTHKMPRGRASFMRSSLTYDTLSVDGYIPVEPIWSS